MAMSSSSVGRYRIKAAYLLNWLGYRAQTFAFDDPVVQFHGGNGAGKTTAMVACLAPIIPIAKKLDGALRADSPRYSGLRTRIGLDNNPSYSVLELTCGGAEATIFIGAQLVRNPALSIGAVVRPFVISGFNSVSDARAWLMARDNLGSTRVPSLRELEESVVVCGGDFAIYDTVSNYYKSLFEMGVLPRSLRLPDDQDQFASLYLTAFGRDASEVIFRLKDYFLPEEKGLGERIARMDSVFLELVHCRKQMDVYEERHDALNEIWSAANDVVRSAWADDEFAVAYVTAALDRTEEDFALESATHTQIAQEQSEVDAELATLSVKLTDLEIARTECERDVLRIAAELKSRLEKENEYAAVRQAANELESACGVAISSSADAESIKKDLEKHRETAMRATFEAERLASEFSARANRLTVRGEGGTTLPAGLADFVGGSPLAVNPAFDGLSIEDAARLEAVIGPAIETAIVCEDTDGAVKRALEIGSDNIPGHVWIAPTHIINELMNAHKLQNNRPAIVTDGVTVRISRVPENPILGAHARQKTALGFQNTAAVHARDAEAARRKEERIRDLIALANRVIERKEVLFDSKTSIVNDTLSLQKRQRLLDAAPASSRIGAGAAIDGLTPREAELVKKLNNAADAVATSQRRERVLLGRSAQLKQKFEYSAKHLEKLKVRRLHETAEYTERLARRAKWYEISDREPLLAPIRDVVHQAASGNAAVSGESLKRALVAALARLRTAASARGLIAETVSSIRSTIIDEIDKAATGEAGPCLAAWREAHMIASTLTPSEITTTDDPVRAAKILAERVAGLKEEVKRAEDIFRVEARYLEQNIFGIIDEHRSRIDRLNRTHSLLSFGDFEAITLRLESVTRMVELLRDIMTKIVARMSENVGFEDSLEEVARSIERAKGRKLNLTASELLDYRNYVELAVLVRRIGSGDFVPIEEAGPSTGERIGVAFTAMLMVLADWESRSNDLFRGRIGGSLRFLVIDEASRLDRGALETIAGFADGTGAQVLFAAPQEQAIPGRSTAYTMVKHRSAGETQVNVKRVLTRGRTLRVSDG